jgi:hypothetical protein
MCAPTPAVPIEARASPLVAALPQTAVSFGQQGMTTGSRHTGADLLKLNIPAPKLIISDKTDWKTLPTRVRAFVRDVQHVFSLAPWGSSDEARCLFLSQALVEHAKDWYDQWSLARKQYTSAEVLANLVLRFAPQIQSFEEEARVKLRQLSYRMTASDTVPAYQSRFEALLSDIPHITEGERVFSFRQGLTEALASACAIDKDNQPFVSYAALVVHALGAEHRTLATRQTRAAIRSNTAAVQLAEDAVMMENDRPPPTPRAPAALYVERAPMKKSGKTYGLSASYGLSVQRGFGPLGHVGTHLDEGLYK